MNLRELIELFLRKNQSNYNIKLSVNYNLYQPQILFEGTIQDCLISIGVINKLDRKIVSYKDIEKEECLCIIIK